APAAEEEAVSFTDPYIDTPLCTSCNECVNLNGLMFKYNGDKQAILADAKAGTYLQLVTAAEKCPAACIHPGAPRADDKTVTEDLVARAARFN
ncbi:MAG: ferredoxin, partial [Sorangiineae bacterium PRO1]|nr:ferredoxin [Sorangiineae bacterium PRO1]